MVLARSFVGTSTVGASGLALASNKMYVKKVTVPANTLIAAVEARLNTTDNQVVQVRGLLYADNAGVPGPLLSCIESAVDAVEFNGVDRWLSFPVAYYTAAGGDFWIGVHAPDPHNLEIAHETSGGDDQQINSGSNWTIEVGASGASITDPGSHLYSLRASLVSGLTGSTVGTTTVGSQWLQLGNGPVRLRSVALLANTCLASVVTHLRHQVANVPTLRGVVFEDVAGAPGLLRHGGAAAGGSANSILMGTTGRWYTHPVGLWIPANATYWIGVQLIGSGSIDIALETTGGDGGSLASVSDAATWTAGDDLYSIHAQMVS